MSSSTENFIKQIYQFEQNSGFNTKPGTIASALNISNAAATDMSRKLAKKGLLHYEKYQELKLTSTGKKLALNVIRKHRLWETFLFRTFGLSLHEIHREAELLEHQTSDFLAEKLNSYLGHPDKDPHGDPIPVLNGYRQYDKESIVLSEAEADRSFTISRLFSSDKEFFDFCRSNHIEVGTKLRVENQYLRNRMTEIMIGKDKLLIHKDFAKHIFVTHN